MSGIKFRGKMSGRKVSHYHPYMVISRDQVMDAF